MNTTTIVSAACAALMAGCASMSGLDAKSDFACKAPDGILCESMSGIYANAVANNLPGQRVTRASAATTQSSSDASPGVITSPISSGTPIRSAPLVLRVWVAPWEDSDGDLHDQSYVYLQVDSGKWLIEHNRRRIQDAFRPVRAPAQTQSSAGPAPAARVKVTPPGQASVNDDPAPPAPTAQEMLQGLLRPGVPGAPGSPGVADE